MTAIAAGLTTSPGTLLRFALKLDAVVSGANGVAYLAAAGLLDSPLGVDADVLRPLGAFLLLYAAAIWFLATRAEIRPLAVRAVIEGNAIWVTASLVVLAANWLSPTLGGGVWIALQATVVAGFAALQAYALRR